MVPTSSPPRVDVRLDGLQLSPTNPRTHFDATRHAELTASIQAQGILVPLLCRPFGDLRLSDIHRPKKTLLDEVAARYNVDTNAIRKQVTRTLEAKATKREAARPSRQSRRAHFAATTP